MAEKTRANAKHTQIAEHSRKELSRIMTEGKKPAIEKSSKKPLNESNNSWLTKLVKDWKDNYED